MADLTFEFSLLSEPNATDLAVQAGIDLDGDELKRQWGASQGKIWRGKKSFDGTTKGIAYLLHFSVGKGVRWRLLIQTEGRDLIAPIERTTTTENTRWSGRLQK